MILETGTGQRVVCGWSALTPHPNLPPQTREGASSLPEGVRAITLPPASGGELERGVASPRLCGRGWLRRLRVWLAVFFCLGAVAAQAADLKPFVRGSLTEIAAARPGRPYILAFWSLSCSHCREELGVLSGLLKQHPALSVVLVSTDTPEDAAAIAATLAQYRLGGAESWVFADSFSERLRAAVDRKWRGELPRTYLYDSAHQSSVHSGKLRPEQLAAWLEKVQP